MYVYYDETNVIKTISIEYDENLEKYGSEKYNSLCVPDEEWERIIATKDELGVLEVQNGQIITYVPETPEFAKMKISNIKCDLTNTDWVISKISEAELLEPGSSQVLVEKYKSILEDRARWRQEINELQEKYNLE